MEFTAPYTPQFDGVVEWEFLTIQNQAMTYMFGSDMSTGEQRLHWAHSVDAAPLPETCSQEASTETRRLKKQKRSRYLFDIFKVVCSI